MGDKRVKTAFFQKLSWTIGGEQTSEMSLF